MDHEALAEAFDRVDRRVRQLVPRARDVRGQIIDQLGHVVAQQRLGQRAARRRRVRALEPFREDRIAMAAQEHGDDGVGRGGLGLRHHA